LYRLSDNYLRFYIHYIEPNLKKIEQGSFLEVPLSSLPGWESMLGFQLENFLLKNRSLLYQALGISPVLFHLGPVSDTLLSSRYFYRIIDIADIF
jgi:hypothetical protein